MKITNLIQLISTLSLSLFIWACDSSPEALSQEQVLESQKQQTQIELQKEAEERLNRAERPIMILWREIEKKKSLFDFECEDCPRSMGQLIVRESGFMKNENGDTVPATFSSNCQGGLIGESLYLTSRHCLPEALHKEDASCEGQAQVIFPKTQNTKRRIVECEKIVSFASHIPNFNEKKAQPDWALLKLKKPLKKRVSRPSKEGIKDGQKLYAYIPLRSIEGDYFNMELLTCTAIQNSLYLPEFENDKSPIALIKCDKDMTKGFSGSLLFDGLGRDAKPVATLSHIWDEGRGIDNVIVSKNGIVSNLSCALFEKDESKPEYCQFTPNNTLLLKQKVTRRALKKAYETSLKLFEEWMAKNDSPLKWEKVTPQNINNLPNIYGEFVENRKNTKSDFVPKGKESLSIRATIPYFAQCVKDITQKSLNLPGVHVQILKKASGKLRPVVKLTEAPGVLHFNNELENRYVTVFEGATKPSQPKPHENFLLSDTFFHSVYLLPCE